MGKTRRGRNGETPRHEWTEVTEADSQQWTEPGAASRQKSRHRRGPHRKSYQQEHPDYDGDDDASEEW